jgi:hypothetical protein
MDAAERPLPREETTPPVIKRNFVFITTPKDDLDSTNYKDGQKTKVETYTTFDLEETCKDQK